MQTINQLLFYKCTTPQSKMKKSVHLSMIDTENIERGSNAYCIKVAG